MQSYINLKKGNYTQYRQFFVSLFLAMPCGVIYLHPNQQSMVEGQT